MLDAAQDTRNPWLYGRTVDSLVDGLRVSVTRETRAGCVHVELRMRVRDIDVISGNIAVATDTWETLVHDLPAAYGFGARPEFAEAIRARGLDFDATLVLARRPATNDVSIALRPASLSRASCYIETVVSQAAWARLVSGVSVARSRLMAL